MLSGRGRGGGIEERERGDGKAEMEMKRGGRVKRRRGSRKNMVWFGSFLGGNALELLWQGKLCGGGLLARHARMLKEEGQGGFCGRDGDNSEVCRQ